MQRVLALIKDSKAVDALKVCQAAVKAAPGATDKPDVQLAGALGMLCCAKLLSPVPPDLQAATTAIQTPDSTSLASAILHLARALQPSRQPGSTQLVRVPGVSAKPTAASAAASMSPRAAVGEALAFLMHPLATQLPPSLLDEAMKLICDKAPAAMAPGAGALQPMTPAARALAERRQLESEAQGSEVLSELMKLTGMTPIKRQMLGLRDEVRGGGQTASGMTQNEY